MFHLEDECTWRWWIPNVIKGMDHYLGYPGYARMFADLCFCVVSTLGQVLEITTLSLEPFLFYMYLIWVGLGFSTFSHVYI